MSEKLTQLSKEAMGDLSESEFIKDRIKVYLQHQKYEIAENLIEQAIAKRSRAMGTEDQGIAQLLDQLALTQVKLGNFEKAHENFEKAISILEKKFYEGHYLIGPILANQGNAYLLAENLEKAETTYTRALEIFGKTLSGDHRFAMEASYKLASIQRLLGKHADSQKLITKMKKLLEAPLAPLDEFLFLEALVMEEQSKPLEAEKAYKEAILEFERRKNIGRLGHCLKRYSEFLTRQKRHEEAKANLTLGVDLIEKSSQMSRNEDIFPATIMRA